jgi:hypothetical protein
MAHIVVCVGVVFLACSSDGSDNGSGSSGAATTGAGVSGLPDCVGTCEPGEPSCFETSTCGTTMCETDNDCPSAAHDYTANGPRCVTACGIDRLCRTPCSMGCPMGTECNAIADDGTEYCEIGLTRCETQTSCGEFLICLSSFRPKP